MEIIKTITTITTTRTAITIEAAKTIKTFGTTTIIGIIRPNRTIRRTTWVVPPVRLVRFSLPDHFFLAIHVRMS